MIVITGDCRNKKMVNRLERLGWGRMMVAGVGPRLPFTPYHGEPYGIDNGAFPCWLRGKDWDEQKFRDLVERVAPLPRPYLAVLPDIVAGGKRSLDLSKWWRSNLPDTLPWYLAVQDGLEPRHINGMDRIAGIFLGGTDRYKQSALAWSTYAHGRGIRFHYGRAGTPRKVRYAKFARADSIDSSFPLWTRERFDTFEHVLNNKANQIELELEAQCVTG